MNNNKLIVFVGAGVSMNSGLPSWNELVKILAGELGFYDKQKNEEFVSILNDEQKDYFNLILSRINCFSNDECLKIPQYYSLMYGEHEYLKRIKEIFNNTHEPNPIDYLIFDLNPVHIITTNYDDLLEITASNLQKNFSAVSSDKALAMVDNSQLIIKMHGDFNKFVLRESDYDTYSNDFKLIETYVKGLIATNTILFVGFSAEDVNVRRILQWIKDILGDEHKPAYMLNIDRIKNSSEKEQHSIKMKYFQDFQINTIYYDEISKEIEDNVTNEMINEYSKHVQLKLLEDNELGKRLFRLLYYIINYKDNTEESNVVNQYYGILKELKS